jgi:hypothetical protein
MPFPSAPVAPYSSIGHPCNSSFYFCFLILGSRQDYLDEWSAWRKASTYTGHHKDRIKAHTDIHALSWIRTQDPIVRASKDSSCLRPRGHCERPPLTYFLFHPNILVVLFVRVSRVKCGLYGGYPWQDRLNKMLQSGSSYSDRRTG